MRIVLPFYSGDVWLAKKNLEWMAELDGHLDYECVLASDITTNHIEVEDLAKTLFRSVRVLKYHRAQWNGRLAVNWPWQQNHAFFKTCEFMQTLQPRDSWLWMETDAVPICAGWLTALEVEYQKGGKPFGGHWNARDSVFNGVGIYPARVGRHSTRALMASRVVDNQGRQPPWDVYCSKEVKPMLHIMNPIMTHLWAGPGEEHAPTFPNAAAVDKLIMPRVVLFHRCKDGSLIDRLRERALLLTTPASQPSQPVLMPGTVRAFVHVVEQHAESVVPKRKQVAWRTWNQIGLPYQRRLYSKYKRTEFNRQLPFLRDVLEFGLEGAQADDVVFITNDDNTLRQNICWVMAEHLKKMPFGCSFRTDAPANEIPKLLAQEPPFSFPAPNNCGHDLFFFKAEFLRAVLPKIPDFVLGAWKWDLILALQMRQWAGLRVDIDTVRANTSVELLYGHVLHEQHQSVWAQPHNINALPEQKYNYNLYLDWIEKNAPELKKDLP